MYSMPVWALSVCTATKDHQLTARATVGEEDTLVPPVGMTMHKLTWLVSDLHCVGAQCLREGKTPAVGAINISWHQL